MDDNLWMYLIFNKDKIKEKTEQWTKEAEKAGMTLTEYLVDYASDETKEVGFQMIDEELKKITKDSVRKIAAENIEAIKNSNRRDFRF
jgi:hypothetical protein